MKVEELIALFPRLYHMGAYGCWPNVLRLGLLSTELLLDVFEVSGSQRRNMLMHHRPESVVIWHPVGRAVIRDQKPLQEAKLTRCLTDMVAGDWYRLLNCKVFFWPTEQRVESLLTAKAYRQKSQTILTVDTRSLLERNLNRVSLSPINSGATLHNPPERGTHTFQSVEEYDFEYWKRKRRTSNAIAEIAVNEGILNMEEVVILVEQRDPDGGRETIWSRP